MKRGLPLYILLAFLIVVNGFFLYNYLVEGEKEAQTKERKPPAVFLIDQLSFDETQKEAFRALNHEHRQAMRNMSDEIRALKDELFLGLSEASLSDRNTDSIATLIGNLEKRKDLEVLHHFKEVQGLCNAEQKEKFSKIIKDALRRGGAKKHGPPPGVRRGPNEERPHKPMDDDMNNHRHRPPKGH